MEFIIHTDFNRESIYNAMVGTTQVITGVGHNVGGVEMTCGQEPSLWFSQEETKIVRIIFSRILGIGPVFGCLLPSSRVVKAGVK